MTAQKLVATDTIHAIPVSLLAGVGYLTLGLVDLELLGLLLIGSIPAAVASSFLLKHLPSDVVKYTLALALLAASTKMIVA